MKKRLSSLFTLILLTISLASCSSDNVLLFLNWGEYIDEALIEAFEEEYNCQVIMDLADSNEAFYSKVSAGTTVYDIVAPSDYMVEKMYEHDMLKKIDFTKIPSYSKDNYLDGVNDIIETMEENNAGISDYFMPYLWGSWGIMYSTLIEGLEDSVVNSNQKTGSNWSSLFNRDYLPTNTRVAMYDSNQHAYYIACKYLGLDNTAELSTSDLQRVYNLIKTMSFDAWGTDNIKKDIVVENLDLGFMWTGDFLYYYCEQAASILIDALEANDLTLNNYSDIVNTITSDERVYSANGNSYEIGFDIYIPDDTIAFCDNLVITKNSTNEDLAYKFLDFMNASTFEGEEDEYTPAYDNCYYVCYNTPLKSVYNDILDLSSYEITEEDLSIYEEQKNSGIDMYETDLYYCFYDIVIGIAFEKYYPYSELKGTILSNFDRKYVNTINTTFNNARA